METAQTGTEPINGGVVPNGQAPTGLDGEKRGRGRPPGSVSKKKIPAIPPRAAVKGGSSTPAASNKDAHALDNARFLATGFVGLVELAEMAVLNHCSGKIEKRMPGKLDEFRAMAGKYSLGEKESQIVASCVEKIVSRHDLLTRFGPEVLLGVILSQHAARQLALVRFVNNVTAQITTTAAPAPSA